jgi:hypothetical protein
MFKVLNSNGKIMGVENTYRDAINLGMSMFESDFMVKEGTRKTEKIDESFRRWYNWFNSPERKIIKVDGGFRMV